MKIKKNDTVQVIAGKDKGKTGTVLRAFPKTDHVIVEGVHVAKRHERPSQKRQHGQIVDKALPIHVSNVQLIDPKTKKPTRIRIEKKDGEYMRISIKSGSVIK
jgi:large subunit ribosomal protein L24